MVTHPALTRICEGSIPSASVAHGRRNTKDNYGKWCHCERRKINLGICAKNSAGCECVDIRIIAEKNPKAKEF